MYFVKLLLSIFFTFAALCTVLSFFGSIHWRYDLLSHFRVQYALFFIVLLFVGVYLRWRLYVLAAFVFFLINSAQILPFYLPQQVQRAQSSLVVMSANVWRDNRETQKLLRFIQQSDPDIIFLQEVNTSWFNDITILSSRYPYQIARVREDYFGIVLFSKYPLTNQRIEHMGRAKIPTLMANVTFYERTFLLIGTHTFPPVGRDSTVIRNDHIEEIGHLINAQTLPVLFVGDMNMTPFSLPYRRLLDNTELTHCMSGFGYQGTWHRTRILPPLGLMIDHCFFTDGITILESYVGGDIGSDHRPIINKISL